MEFHGIKQSPKVILMKVTSRERPDVLLNTVSSYVRFAANTNSMVWLFSFDANDALYNNKEFLQRLNSLVPVEKSIVIFGESTGKIDAINRDVNSLTEDWDILLNISDDQVPVYQGYDDVIRRFMPDDLDASL